MSPVACLADVLLRVQTHSAEREELAKLRKQVRELTMERDIRKEAAILFTKHRR